MQIYIFMGSVRFILSAKHHKKNLLYVAYFMLKITEEISQDHLSSRSRLALKIN